MPEMPRDLENRSATVAIIGAGPLGRWLALATARAGFRVLLEDVMPANLHHAQEYLRRELSFERARLQPCRKSSEADATLAAERIQVTKKNLPQGLKPGESLSGRNGTAEAVPFQNNGDQNAGPSTPVAAATSAQDDGVINVTFVSTIEDAVREADLAIDCVPDELESKLEILWLLDRMAPPRTVLATPTTRLSIADLANCTYRPSKCIAIAQEASSLAANAGGEILLHTTSHTSPETVALVDHFWRQLGFTPRFEPDPAEQSAS
jgi:3-hydroxybutyryl-CoA dehydrogenase